MEDRKSRKINKVYPKITIARFLKLKGYCYLGINNSLLWSTVQSTMNRGGLEDVQQQP